MNLIKAKYYTYYDTKEYLFPQKRLLPFVKRLHFVISIFLPDPNDTIFDRSYPHH